MASAFQSVVPEIIGFEVPAPLRRLLSRVLGIDELERVYSRVRRMDDAASFPARVLDFLSIRCAVSDADLAQIPRAGGAIVTANHPFGILDGAAMARILGEVRGDVRFLANGILSILPELRDVVIPVDPAPGPRAARTNSRGLRKALEHLEAGGMLVVFPAGEVSSFRWRERALADPEWNPSVARIAGIAAREKRPVNIIPAYIAGANGPLFHLAGIAHPRCRTALLGRELLNKSGRRVEVRVGTPVSADKLLAIPTAREQVDYLRWRTYLLGRREQSKPRTSAPLARSASIDGSAAVAPQTPAHLVSADISALPPKRVLGRSGDLVVYLAAAHEIPNALREIGRLREITFRAAGEGTGSSLDVDEFDTHYLHLFVWNARREEIAGAYRMAGTDRVAGHLYTRTLFRYDARFLERLGPALELGRSFVRKEYQKGFTPLLLLWKGIGAYVARNPRYKILFGPVSISNQYAAASRELMVGFLEKYATLREWAGLTRGRRPLRRTVTPGLPAAGLDVDDLSAMLGDLEPNRAGVPVLLRQYLRLGGKLLGFNVDRKFSNVLDGLILVDLTRTDRKLLERYLGKSESETFLEFQKGTHGTQKDVTLDERGAAHHRGSDSLANAIF
jgi:putative hemolysin